MKKILFYILFLFGAVQMVQAQQQPGCCPEFELRQSGEVFPCQGDSSCKAGSANPVGGNAGNGAQQITACKNSAQTYYVVPDMPGFTYSWQIVGGTPLVASGNPVTITWGSGSQGFLQVIIKNSDSSCRDTITRKICLLDAPVAAFSFLPNDTVCANSTPILFNAASSVGAVTYSWNFGDGSTATGISPSHLYTTPGTYTVVLTVSNASGGGANGDLNRCGCTDTATAQITVLAGTGTTITSSCKKMLCPGDTATYCVTTGCAPFNWTVNGGTIIANNGNCITVQWNTPPVNYPTSVSVTTGCGGPCGNAATLNVPVLYNNIPITGEDTVCVGTNSTYSLPSMPGTFYTWTVTGGGGGTIVGPSLNTPSVNINWAGPPGNATITCNYSNPYSGCSGSTTFSVKVRPRFTVSGPASVCAASSSGYTATGNSNWTIFPGTGYTTGSLTNVSAISVNWTTAGTYTITATPVSGNYCNPAASINVVVKPKPVLSVISGPVSVCANSYAFYSVSSNLNGPFTWTATNGTVITTMGTANNDTVVVQWNGSPSHTIQVTQTVNGCSTSASLAVSNIPAPTISGANTACRDQSVTYTASGSLPPGSYTWSISPAAAGTITGGQGTNAVTILWHGAASPGTNSATVSVAVCGNTVNYSVAVTTPPNGTISKTGSLCASGVVLTLSGFTCTTYQWYLNGSPVATTSVPSYTATQAGYYEVKCATGCGGFAGTFVPKEFIPNVNITADNSLPICSTTPINVNLFSAAPPGCSLMWYKNGVSTGLTSGTITINSFSQLGTYFAVVTCGNCKDTSNALLVDTIFCEPNCDLSYVPRNSNIGKAGPLHEPDFNEKALYTATLNIGPPSNPCNNTQFSATYSFTSPHSLNSGIHWNFGDNSGFSTTTSGGFTPPHAYTAVGTYVVTAWVLVNCPGPKICTLMDTIHYTVPVAAKFNYSVNCDKILLSNLSTVISGCSITSYAWSATGPGSASFSSTSAASPVLTVGQSGTYNVTLTVTSSCNGCTATITLPVTVSVPTASFTIPPVVCAGAPVSFNAPGGMMNYLWEFGDLPSTYTSSQQNTTHAYAATPTPPYTTTATLTVWDAMGCIAKDTELVQIIAPPVLNITPDTLICRGSTVTLTASNGFTNYAWYHNNTLVQNGPSASYTTGVMGTYYVIGTSSNGCVVKSVETHVFYKKKPVADIQGPSVACLYGGTAYINLQNSENNPLNTYNWTLLGNNTSLSTTYDLNTTQSSPGNYSYVLTVTGANGCVAMDTFCVVVATAPTVTVTGGSPGMCAGVAYTFTASATPANPNYVYQWSNGVTGTTMTTSLPGIYMVNVLDPASGCTGTGFAGNILPRPSTLLFPVGCDTLCDTASVIPPLPLAIGQNYSMYTIQWLNNGVPISPQPSPQHILNLGALGVGQHNISIVVTLNGCSDTSGVYNLYVKSCDCDCDKSYWGDILLGEGELGKTKGDPIRIGDVKLGAKDQKKTGGDPIRLGDVKLGANQKSAANVPTGSIKLECYKLYELKCKQPYTLTANYICADTSCPSKVTFSLQPPTGSPITGTLGYTFTPNQTGIYMATLYGWCGDKICDTCVIEFSVKCDTIPPPNDCCKGSTWEAAPWFYFEGKTKEPKKIDCNKEMTLAITGDLCKQPLVVGASIACPPNCVGTDSVFVYNNANVLVQSGPAPLTITGLANGNYTVVVNGYCGGKLCLTCKFFLKVDCKQEPDCDCKGSKWGERTITINNTTKPLKCQQPTEKPMDVKCKVPITINALYNCVGANCPGTVNYTLVTPSGTQTGTLPPALTFVPSQSGLYTLTLVGMCGNKACDTCVVRFRTECPVDSICCPYNIKVDTSTVTYAFNQQYNATIASQNFIINGLAGVPLTEVRAEVMSYSITDNFGKECMKCINLPYTWASVLSAGNIGTVPPKITMFNSTVHPFNPTGAGQYQNPREVVWNSGSNFSIPNNTGIGMNFILPPAPLIDCCELKGRICVKFTFRDKDCKECEVISCFEFIIKNKKGF